MKAVGQDDEHDRFSISLLPEITDGAKLAAGWPLHQPRGQRRRSSFIAGHASIVYRRGANCGRGDRVPSVEATRAAHDSPPYQEALAALDGEAVRDMRIVPGVE